MDFRLTQEQELLRDSARRYFAAQGRFDKHRLETAAADEAWSHFADAGWLAMLAPEECDGLDSPLEDIAILCEEMGRGLDRSAFIGGAVLPARVLRRCESSPSRAPMLSALAEGSARIALAVYEPGLRYGLLPRATAVAMPDGSWRISGEKTLVPGGAQADRLIVSAVTDGGSSGAAQPSLFVVDVKAAGVGRRVYPTIDGVEAADFSFAEVVAGSRQMLAPSETAHQILQASLDEAIVCLCAETLGGMDRAIELTADYLKTRSQFGRPLAEFQALQHAVAEMWIEANGARSILYRAIAALGADASERGKAVSGCVIKLMSAAKSVTGTAIHLHGGIGVTCEYPVGHYLRRVLVSEKAFGDREHQFARYLG